MGEFFGSHSLQIIILIRAHAQGIISVKGQMDSFEIPMTPITMMRNALGKEEGGSGVPLDRAEYDKAVKYWESQAFVR